MARGGDWRSAASRSSASETERHGEREHQQWGVLDDSESESGRREALELRRVRALCIEWLTFRVGFYWTERVTEQNAWGAVLCRQKID